MNINTITNKYNPVHTINEFQINDLGNDTLLIIFSYLSERDIASCSLVCKQWKNLTDSNLLWKAIYKAHEMPHVHKLLEALLDEGELERKEIGKICEIASFLSKIEARSSEMSEFSGLIVDHCMFKRHIRSGPYHFTVLDEKDVNIREVGIDSERILKGRGEHCLTHLAVEGEYLFALTSGGIVLQWNFLNGDLVREIETKYSKEKVGCSKSSKPSSICHRNCFIVQEGCVVVLYGHYWQQTVLEVITGKDFTNHIVFGAGSEQLRDGEKLYFGTCKNLMVKNQVLYGTFQNGIFSINIKTEKFTPYLEDLHQLQCSAKPKEYLSIDGGTALVSLRQPEEISLQILKLNLLEGTWSQPLFEGYRFPMGTLFVEINHFLILAQPTGGSWNLTCFDSVSEKELLEIKDILKDSGKLDPEQTETISPDHFKKIVEAYKQHCLDKRVNPEKEVSRPPLRSKNKKCVIQ